MAKEGCIMFDEGRHQIIEQFRGAATLRVFWHGRTI
jgi:hypothetical protein